ncbi:hypothetical protein [Rubellicoccus peritrichatus]|uniref:Uncharacterized protein n=1 Tax=Rubellicoccus peritrichatus TaxID=3080537 RepID=A0AAQ3L8G7_9BACT|nr:hypothetical protein [Puniceicoccus sp. CR14]WOO41031.1 hypothetical protein RZN69_20620 [Puniceicoccus sp. CR14]
MAFTVLLFLSLSTIVSINLAGTKHTLEQESAQNNALFGLAVALGNLQKATGPDQRVTTTAAVFDSTPDTPAIDGVAHPRWLGVWDSDPGLAYMNDPYNESDAYYRFAQRKSDSGNSFLGWLVSGDFKTLSDYSTGIDSNSGFEIPGSQDAYNDEPVIVQKVDIIGGDSVTGRYAFWVSDENQKAFIDKVNVASTQPDVDRGRFMLHQRSAIESINTSQEGLFDEFGLVENPNQVSNADSLTLVLPDIQQEIEASYLDDYLTTTASGLLTNAKLSGLKTDLSSVLRGQLSDGLEGVPGYAVGSETAIVRYPQVNPTHQAPPAPTWQQTQSYFQSMVGDDETLQAAKHTSGQHGFFPIITRYRMDMTPQFERSTNPAVGDRFFMNIAPVIVMLNPYNVSLSLSGDEYVNFYFEVRDVAEDRGLFIGNEWVKRHGSPQYIEVFSGNPPITQDQGPYGNPDVHNFLDNGSLHRYTDPSGIDYVGMTFRMPETTMAPGEVVAFGVANDGDFYTGSNRLEVGAFDTNPKVVRLVNQDADGNELRAHPEWSQRNASNISGSNQTYLEAGALQINTDASASHTHPSRLVPFNLAIGLSDSPTPEDIEDFYQIALGVECSSPNTLQLYINPLEKARNYRAQIPSQGFDDFEEMTRRALRFDVALGAGFNDPSNDMSGDDYEHGYLINNRWFVGHNMRAPYHLPSAADDLENAPNNLYGAIAGYAPGAYGGDGVSQQMHVPEIQMNGSNAFWGTGLTIADGVDQISLLDIPRSDFGVLSIGQLQHMSVSTTTSSHFYGVANGLAELKISDTGALASNTGFPDVAAEYYAPVDQSYILNDALFDEFYFSGFNQAINQADLEGLGSPAFNQRYQLADDALVSDLENPGLAAKALQIDGAFNINSMHPNAWKALLAGANGVQVNIPGEGQLTLDNPISRTGFPQAGPSVSSLERMNGFRELTDSELEDLSQAIVTEVKERAPFFSVSDFVNRRLMPGNVENGLYGTLENAIRNSNLNAFIQDDTSTPLSEQYAETDIPQGRNLPSAYNREILESHLGEGTPQWISQGDILQRISHLLTARGDTFTIYAYGESLDSLTGEVTTRALCQVVVKRTYEYIDSLVNTSDEAKYVFNNQNEQFEVGTLTDLNEDFGRSYVITSMRWIEP